MEYLCKHCGTPFKRTGKKPAVFCSRVCKSAASSMHIASCEVCQKPVIVYGKRPGRFCSRTCKGIASRLPKKICAVCKKEWQPHFGRANQPCCSLECGYEYRKHGTTIPCGICGKGVYVSKARQETGRKIFCGREHAEEYQARNKTSHICIICGKTFRWSPSISKRRNIKYCSIPCRDADPNVRAKLIELNVMQQKLYPSKPEKIGYGLLDELGINYLPQHLIGDKFCVDAFLLDEGVVVQFDGDYWHGNPEKFPDPDPRQIKRMKLDQSQDAYMAKCGYPVIRIWESSLKNDLESVRHRLLPFATQIEQTQSAQE